jgi:integrase
MSYCHQGREVRESTGTTDEKKARKTLCARIRAIANDREGIQPFLHPKAARTTVNDLLDALEQDYRIRNKLSPSVRSHLKRARHAFGATKARSLDAAHIDAWIETELSDGRAPATINRSTQLLSQAFNLGLLQKNVTSKPYIRKLPEENTREGFFEHDEFERVVQFLPEYLQDFARFDYLTGWRTGELKQLEWTQVERRSRILHLTGKQSKNGKPRKVALEGTLREIIERRWNQRTYETNGVTYASTFVFHNNGRRIGDCRKAWKTACKAAGVPEKLLHDFRRTAVRNMIRAGVPETVAMKISGHRTRSIFDRYNITSEEDLRDAITKTEAYLQQL